MKQHLLSGLFCFFLVPGLLAQVSDSLQIVHLLDSLIKSSFAQSDKNKYDHALPLADTVEQRSARIFGYRHPLYAASRHQRGRILMLMGKYPEAETVLLENYRLREAILGKTHRDYYASLCLLGNLYHRMEQTDVAERWYLDSKSQCEATLGPESATLLNTLLDLGDFYIKTSRYSKAEPIFLQAKSVCEKTLGTAHGNYNFILSSLAGVHRRLGAYMKAEPYIREAMALAEAKVGKNHHLYAASLNNLANLYWDMGQYDKAVSIHLESKDIRGRTLGKEHPDYAQSLTNLANLYLRLGRYESAEEFLNESKKIREKVYGKNHAEYAKSTMGLAYLYLLTGNYPLSEKFYLDTKSIREKKLGKEHSSYALTLNGLAILYETTDNSKKAEEIYQEVLSIQEKVLGKQHPYYTETQNNLASLYIKNSRYVEAEALLLQAKAMRESKKDGREHPAYCTVLENLSKLHTHTGQLEKAESYALEALAGRERMLGQRHADYAKSHFLLGNIYAINGEDALATAFYRKMAELDRNLLRQAVNYLPESEMEQYLTLFREHTGQLCSFTGREGKKHPEMTATAWDNELFSKQMLLENSRAMEHAAAAAGPELRQMHQAWKEDQRQLGIEYTKPLAEQTGIAAVERHADSLEKILIRSLKTVADNQQEVNWQDIRYHLKPAEAAIEFVRYPCLTPEGKMTDSVLYAAMILTYNGHAPEWVSLCNESELERLLIRDKKRVSESSNQLYSASALYELVWKSLEQHLSGISTVWYAPSGMLHRINFDALFISPGQILSDRYRLLRTGSTRQITVRSAVNNSGQDAVLYGGIRYELQKNNQEFAATDTEPENEAANRSEDQSDTEAEESLRGGSWRYLPFTDREVTNIELVLAQNKFRPLTRRGTTATEETVKRIGEGSRSPKVLHIATHGFSFPPATSAAQSIGMSDIPAGIDSIAKDATATRGEEDAVLGNTIFRQHPNPMMRSGLLFAGANLVWKGGAARPGEEDGILTAFEISQMNLTQTELVVLSACETGLGDTKGNEGVYGLQRAFKKAGAGYLILSLWQVPDKQTSQLMTAFYKNWTEQKMPVPDAFRAAQQQMRALGLEPYKWAGFILTN